MRLVLASASARRRELLEAAGLTFVVDPQAVDESRLAGEAPEGYALRVSRDKVQAGRAKHPHDAVLGADTVVVIDGLVMGKPASDEDAAGMLRRLSGRTHEVFTAVALAWPGRERTALERTEVRFISLDETDIRHYVATGEPRDKAGAYAIQGAGGRFVARVEGSYSNVVGLPVATVLQLLREAGIG
jgi:septum formation protein